ncbi:hypothetical protein [Acinetobacter sp. YH12063]|uniref:hypothetical protein n=1 Tax=Acinetobacter sp. YH12063 TaxID=2601061 RepID=UPI0015D1EBAA|nr:hypothetical protein [Acinetobacter sp. YH12063]
MSKYTDFKSMELVLDRSNPYVMICDELIDESKSRLLHLATLTGLPNTELLNFFYWIGGYGLMKSMVASDDDESVKEVLNTTYKDAQNAFIKLNKLSKITLTWEQVTSLAVGIVTIEMILLEITVDRESKKLSEVEQYEIFKTIIKIINRANFLIGHAMSNISESIELKQIKMASTGGKAKAKNYLTKMNPIFDEAFNLYQTSNPITGKKWKSKSECVKFFIKDFYLKNPNTEIELDTKKLVEEITIRLNDPFASRKVSLLAERSVC